MRILSLDGGGVRGIIPAHVMLAVEHTLKRPIAHTFDIVAGTSIGGIMALMIAQRAAPDSDLPRRSAREVLQLFRDNAPRIFQGNGITFNGMLASRYAPDGLRDFLHEMFGDEMLSDLLGDSVIAVSYEIEHRAPVVFSSARARTDTAHNFLLRDVALATSAAPTFFPPAHVVNADGMHLYMVDGGLIANNPAQRALMEARRLHPHVPLSQYIILSLGTGTSNAPIYYQRAYHMGKVGWVSRVIDITLDGASELVHTDLLETFGAYNGDRGYGYMRLQCTLGDASEDIDDITPGNMRALELNALNMLREREVDLAQLCTHLVMQRCDAPPSARREPANVNLESLQRMNMPLVVFDRHGVVWFVNRAYHAFTTSPVVPHHVLQCVVEEDRSALLRAIRRVASIAPSFARYGSHTSAPNLTPPPAEHESVVCSVSMPECRDTSSGSDDDGSSALERSASDDSSAEEWSGDESNNLLTGTYTFVDAAHHAIMVSFQCIRAAPNHAGGSYPSVYYVMMLHIVH